MFTKASWKKIGDYSIFALPATAIFCAVVCIPFLYGIFLTFTSWDGLSTESIFIGWSNYKALFKEESFWTSILLTIRYVFFSVVIMNLMAFSLAMALTKGFRGQGLIRAGIFTPNLIGGIILGLLWRFIFSRAFVYIGNTLDVPLLAKSWLGDPQMAFWALVVGTVWQYTGYLMVIYIAGLMNIPKSLIEAAEIDGANEFVKLKNITMPFMVPALVVSLFISLQRTFIVYDVNLSLTQGGPFKSSVLASMHVYNKAFIEQKYGVGQSEAIVLFLMVAIVTVLQVYFTKKQEITA